MPKLQLAVTERSSVNGGTEWVVPPTIINVVISLISLNYCGRNEYICDRVQ